MSRWRWFRSGWDTAISLPPRIFIRIWTTLPRFLRQKRCWTGLEWVQIRKMTLKKVWFLSKTGRFLSCYEIVKLKNSVFCIKKRYKALKKARCTVDWRSIRDLNSGGATNALSHFESSTSRYSSYISLFRFALKRLFSVLTLVFDILTYFVLYVACGCLGNI